MLVNSTQPCYQWGGVLDEWVYTPCNSSEGYSMCCRTVQAVGASTPDYCLPNGLCSNFNNDIDDLEQQTFWIESCSDPSWKSDACAPIGKYLKADEGCYRDSAGNAPLGFCSELGTYCCNQNIQNATCCDTSINGNMIVDLPVASMVQETTSFDGQIYTTFLPTMRSTSTTSAVSSASTTPTSNSLPISHEGSTLSVGSGVGIGIAVAAVVFLLILGIAYFFRKRSHGRRGGKGSNVRPYHEEEKFGGGDLQPAMADSRARYELPNRERRHELR